MPGYRDDPGPRGTGLTPTLCVFVLRKVSRSWIRCDVMEVGMCVNELFRVSNCRCVISEPRSQSPAFNPDHYLTYQGTGTQAFAEVVTPWNQLYTTQTHEYRTLKKLCNHRGSVSWEASSSLGDGIGFRFL